MPRGDAEVPLKGCGKIIGIIVTYILRYPGYGVLRPQQKFAGHIQALLLAEFENRVVEQRFESAFQLLLIDTNSPCQVRDSGRIGKFGQEDVPSSVEPLYIAGFKV